MELLEYIRIQVEASHFWLEGVMQDLTDEVAAWQPDGTANRIGLLLAHMTVTQDIAVNRWLKGGQTVFEKGGFAAKTGIPEDSQDIWRDDWCLKLEGLREYRPLVQESADAYFASITLADLDREVAIRVGTKPAWDIVKQPVLNHVLLHSGEVSALKGIRGLKGLPT